MTQPARTDTALSRIELAVLGTVVYSDLFDYPLTRSEVLGWLPIASTAEEVDTALDDGGLVPSFLTERDGYVMLRGRDHIVDVRERRREMSQRAQARRYGAMIARLPFVRMVSITGSVAVDNADSGADLDYLIVTAPGRVWLTRAMTMLIVRYAAMRGVIVCPNYLLAETDLEQTAQDRYTARELLQMEPLCGADVYTRLFEANPWWRTYLPNASPSAVVNASAPSIARRIAEAVLRLPPFDLVERALLSRKAAEFAALQSDGDETCFSPTMCKGHFDAWRGHTERRAAERLRQVLGSRP